MRGGFLPPAILCAALGLFLAFIPLRRAVLGMALLVGTAVAVWLLAPPAKWIEPIYVGCWLSVIANALMVYSPARLSPQASLAAAINTGVWAGAVTAVSGRGQDLAVALPLALLFLPGRAVVARGWSIGLKVLASWLTAVAILATMVSMVPTPGYVPDHME